MNPETPRGRGRGGKGRGKGKGKSKTAGVKEEPQEETPAAEPTLANTLDLAAGAVECSGPYGTSLGEMEV